VYFLPDLLKALVNLLKALVNLLKALVNLLKALINFLKVLAHLMARGGQLVQQARKFIAARELFANNPFDEHDKLRVLFQYVG
jgi:ABC-type transporter Mla subunit MlaD